MKVVREVPAIASFRQDLRLSDNPAPAAALKRKPPVIPVCVWAPGEEAEHYFRIFNPMIQSAKFNPQSDFISHWVPELTAGTAYPATDVDHGEARFRAIAALEAIRKQ